MPRILWPRTGRRRTGYSLVLGLAPVMSRGRLVKEGFFQAPVIADMAGTRQVITVNGSNVIGVSVADGQVLWQFPWNGGAGGTMPVLYGDTVIISGLNVAVAGFRPTKSNGE